MANTELTCAQRELDEALGLLREASIEDDQQAVAVASARVRDCRTIIREMEAQAKKDAESYDEGTIEFGIAELLNLEPDFNDDVQGMLPEDVVRVDTFENAGIMTNNRGLVVKMTDGSEFQITIIRSK